MLVTLQHKELKKIVNSLVMGVLKNLVAETKMADREGFQKKFPQSAYNT